MFWSHIYFGKKLNRFFKFGFLIGFNENFGFWNLVNKYKIIQTLKTVCTSRLRQIACTSTWRNYNATSSDSFLQPQRRLFSTWSLRIRRYVGRVSLSRWGILACGWVRRSAAAKEWWWRSHPVLRRWRKRFWFYLNHNVFDFQLLRNRLYDYVFWISRRRPTCIRGSGRRRKTYCQRIRQTALLKLWLIISELYVK